MTEVLLGCLSGILGVIPRGFRLKWSSHRAANPSSTWSERWQPFTSRRKGGSSYTREDSCLLTSSAGCGRLCSWLHRSPKECTHSSRSLSFCYCLRKKKSLRHVYACVYECVCACQPFLNKTQSFFFLRFLFLPPQRAKESLSSILEKTCQAATFRSL